MKKSLAAISYMVEGRVTVKKHNLVLWIVCLLANVSQAGQIVAKTIQEATRISDVVIVATVTKTENTGQIDRTHSYETWRAECAVKEVITGGLSTNMAKVMFPVTLKALQTSLPAPDFLESGKTYVLFIKRGEQDFSLADPWMCCLEVKKEYGVFDEELKGDAKALKSTSSSFDGAPYVTVSHKVLVEKIKKTASLAKKAGYEDMAPVSKESAAKSERILAAGSYAQYQRMGIKKEQREAAVQGGEAYISGLVKGLLQPVPEYAEWVKRGSVPSNPNNASAEALRLLADNNFSFTREHIDGLIKGLDHVDATVVRDVQHVLVQVFGIWFTEGEDWVYKSEEVRKPRKDAWKKFWQQNRERYGKGLPLIINDLSLAAKLERKGSDLFIVMTITNHGTTDWTIYTEMAGALAGVAGQSIDPIVPSDWPLTLMSGDREELPVPPAAYATIACADLPSEQKVRPDRPAHVGRVLIPAGQSYAYSMNAAQAFPNVKFASSTNLVLRYKYGLWNTHKDEPLWRGELRAPLAPVTVEKAAPLAETGKPLLTPKEELSSPHQEIRDAAAATLASNYIPPPRATWEPLLVEIKAGMTKDKVLEVIHKVAPMAKEEMGCGLGRSFNETYRLDDVWILNCCYLNAGNALVSRSLDQRMANVWVAPPTGFTGTWTTYFVNGRKSHVIRSKDGKYNGEFAAFNPDGSRSYIQHYAGHVGEGADIGFFPSGKIRYTGQYKAGKQVGTWVFYNEDGTVSSTQEHGGTAARAIPTTLSLLTAPTIKLGEPVEVSLNVTNNSGGPAKYIPGAAESWDGFEVLGPDGKAVPYIGGGVQLCGRTLEISPGTAKTLIERLDITDQYCLPLPVATSCGIAAVITATMPVRFLRHRRPRLPSPLSRVHSSRQMSWQHAFSRYVLRGGTSARAAGRQRR